MLRSYIAFDIETTGLNPMENEIIEIGALKVRDGIVAERFMEFIHPITPISPMITGLTGITNEMVADARSRSQVVSDFLDFCGDEVLIGHNLPFDYGFVCLGMKAYAPLWNDIVEGFDGEDTEVLNIGDSVRARRIIDGTDAGRHMVLAALDRLGYL